MSRTTLCICAAAALALGSLALMLAGGVAGESLHHLPPAEQHLVEVLLLMPIAALIICVFRNVIGLTSFGTFTPALIGLAFRDLASWPGIFVFVGLLLAGWALRRGLDRFHLLQVPRVSLMLTLIVTMLVGFVVLSDRLGWPATRVIALFPLVILTGMVERFWTLEEEDGARASFRTLLATLFIAAGVSLVISRPFVSRHMMRFPESVGLIMAGQILLGRYMSYRLTELYRFRDLMRDDSKFGHEGSAATRALTSLPLRPQHLTEFRG